jgi:alcohol dehydrogenase (cytochrome c)
MQSTMPPGGAALPVDSYLSLAAFILDANGARGGPQALTATSNVAIRSIASGRRAGAAEAQTAQLSTNQAGANRPNANQARQEAQPPRGITVEGQVKDFVPVTDAALRNPDPADWLMIRRDYKASSFSPLNQITTQNVNDLRLVWSWAMQDGAVLGNQPAPIVHGGVLYVNNNGMVPQALNARTGELIWENRYGTSPTAYWTGGQKTSDVNYGDHALQAII